MSALFGEARRADIAAVAEQLPGGRRLKRVGQERVGPCPRCGGDDRFAINPRKRVFHCRGCGTGGDVIALVAHVLDLTPRQAAEHIAGKRDLPKAPEPPMPQTADGAIAASRRKAHWHWSRRHPAIGSLVETYLREARGYRGPIPETLAYLPPSKPEHHPAMIAALAFASEPEPGVLALGDQPIMGVHLTLLRPDGRGKADGVESPKLTVGQGSVGIPICIAPPNDLMGLAITEGIEDALSVHQATGLGVWAAGSAGRMPALADKVPAYVECVMIAAHPDPAGQTGAIALADALSARGVEVILQGIAP